LSSDGCQERSTCVGPLAAALTPPGTSGDRVSGVVNASACECDVSEGQGLSVTVRKGSVGAFLASVRDWQDPASDDATRATAEADLRGLLPGLHALGLFQVLAARDPALQRLIDSLS